MNSEFSSFDIDNDINPLFKVIVDSISISLLLSFCCTLHQFMNKIFISTSPKGNVGTVSVWKQAKYHQVFSHTDANNYFT